MTLRAAAILVDRDLAAFVGSLDKVKRGSNGWAIALCPMHEDRRPSFSFNEELDGWRCFAGCGAGKLSLLVKYGPRK